MHHLLSRKGFLRLAAGAVCAGGAAKTRPHEVLDPENFRHYIDEFASIAPEDFANYIPDARAWPFLKANIPFFTCPDRDIEQIYYYRWWTYRKHIKETPLGFIVTEFLKPVSHASEYNALSCALGHHIAEGRWLDDRRFVEDDIYFWLSTGDNGGIRKNLHQFSGWVASAVYDRWLVQGDRAAAVRYLDPLILDYQAWESERLTSSGLFWQRDVSDGMEESASGGRRVKNIRPSINSYMYGNGVAIAEIATLAGKEPVAREYRQKAARLKELVQSRLWNGEARFFETRVESGEFAAVRENIGFTPWYFNLPDDRAGYEIAWKQLMDPDGFDAPFGPTTVERRSPQFKIAYEGDDCQWNGPAWPFATTITLKALANVLHEYRQDAIGKDEYFRLLQSYAASQHRKLDDGRVIPWIDEDQNPLTGEWIARAKKIRKPGFYDRGAFYNHSGFADLVITGLAGLRPRADDVVEVNPLLPAGKWEWFCLDRVPYHGQTLTIVWDKSGRRFGKGKGLGIFARGKEIARSPGLARITGRLS
jgi:hypothetical protein